MHVHTCTLCIPHFQSAATVYSPYDGVVQEIMVPEDETAYLEKPLIIFEVEGDMAGNHLISTATYNTCNVIMCMCVSACRVVSQYWVT